MNTQNAVAGIVNRILVNAIALNDTHHIQWPDAAVYCLVFKQHTWPCGWDKEVYVEFFSTKEAFDEKREALLEWVRYEDNDLAMRAQVWDWGPVALTEFDRNLEMLPAENEVCFDAVNHGCT